MDLLPVGLMDQTHQERLFENSPVISKGFCFLQSGNIIYNLKSALPRIYIRISGYNK